MSDRSIPQDPIEDASVDRLDALMSIAFGTDPATERQVGIDGASTTVGRYKLLEQIGEGGFGVVYMAEQQEPIRRRVALKVIKQGMDTKQVVARFEAERQALAMMDHENIASVLDAGATESGRPFFVMELVRGVPITEFCDRNKLNTHNRLKLFLAVCKAVQHAHQKGIIHRDLKPNNVMVTLRDGAPIPKVIDFGVAKATQVRLTDKTVFTRYGQFIGTPAYMSPEQVEMSEFDVDTRSDIYSLGVLLYELLTGTTPIEQDKLRRASYSEMQRMICDEEPPKPSSRLSHSGEALASISASRGANPRSLGQIVRGDLDWIVMKALDKDRSRRYETANGLAMDIQRYLDGEPVTASPPSTTYRLRKFSRKHRRLLTAAAAFGLLLFTSTLVSSWLAVRAMRAENQARYNEGLANERLHQEQLAMQEAEKLSGQLREQLARTDEEVERSQHLLYVAHMNLIQKELSAGNEPRIIDLLNIHRPPPGGRDLRGFEWYHAWGLCHRYPWIWQHHASVTSVAYSPDGNFVVSGCSDGRLQVWDVETGRVVAAVNGHFNNVTSIVISEDSRLIATSSFDLMAKTWTFESGRLLPTGAELRHAWHITSVAVSPDGTRLAVCDGRLTLWDLETGVERHVDIDEPILAVAFSRDGRKLAAGGDSTRVMICDFETAAVTGSMETTLANIREIAYSPIDDSLALGDALGAVEIVRDSSPSRRLGQHFGSITDLEFSADGRTLASCGADELIVIWDLERMEKADMLRGHSSIVHAVAFSRDGKSLVSASQDNTVRLWDLARGQPAFQLASNAGPVGPLAFSPMDRPTLASGGSDGAVRIWNVDESAVAETLPPIDGPIRCVAFSPDGKTLAYGGGPVDQPAYLLFWDTERKTVRRTAVEHSKDVLAVAFSHDGRTLASGGNDGRLILWDVATATVKAKLESNTEAITSVAFSPSGEQLATGSFHQNEITLWSLSDPGQRRLLAGHQDWVTSVAFSPDGSKLASASVDRTVRIWDVAAESESLTLPGHVLRVNAVTFSADGTSVASISPDNRLILWDVATGQEKASLDCRPDVVGATLAFSTDGRMLAAASGQSIVVHRAATDEDFHYFEAPRSPLNDRWRPGETPDEFPVTLQAAPFSHRHPDVRHLATLWQVRTSEGTYAEPVVHVSQPDDSCRLSVPRGILLPNTTYYWRVAFTGSNHLSTPFSEETPFTTGDFPFAAVPFDLSAHFNRDVVQNPGDSETDSFDTTEGCHLVVEGFDGDQADNPSVQGLPRDRRVGLHVLGDYDGPNAIQTGLSDEDRSPIRIAVPPDRYRFVRFLVSGGNGNSDMPVRFEFADRTSQQAIVLCDDWFHDIDENRYGMLREGLLPILNGMDRFYENEFRDNNTAAIFEAVIEVDPAKRLIALILETDSDQAVYTDTALWPDHTRTRFNLLAATGVIIGR